MISVGHYLAVSAVLFTLGVLGIFINRKNIIVILMAIELILLSVNINLVAFSAALGVISIARATLPLALFGRNGFATMLGKLTVPQNMTFAAAPLLFAVLVERLGASGTLVVSAAIQCIALLAMVVLVRRL